MAEQRKYLVFTSAGDRAQLDRWLGGSRNFDLWIVYYGDSSERFKDCADIYSRRKGSKFQNLHDAYRTAPERFARYEAVLVMDDDVGIDGTKISRLFEIRAEHDLWLLQPAFSPWGKVSHPITCVDRTAQLRFTNFIEMTCPLFRRDKLDQFMAVYDPVLVGFGMDWWFLHAIGPDLEGRVAVVDEVVCVNPHDVAKGAGGREIDRLQSEDKRRAVWDSIRERYGIESDNSTQRVYGVVKKHLPARLVGALLAQLEAAYFELRGITRLYLRKIIRRLVHKRPATTGQ